MRYQGTYGHHVRSNWGMGTEEAEYAIGDIVWIPPDAPALLDDRVQRYGLHRVHSCFSIDEGPSFYYRVSPMETTGRGDRLRTRWDICSDRLHVTEGGRDFTEGWCLVHSASPTSTTDASGVPLSRPPAEGMAISGA